MTHFEEEERLNKILIILISAIVITILAGICTIIYLKNKYPAILIHEG